MRCSEGPPDVVQGFVAASATHGFTSVVVDAKRGKIVVSLLASYCAAEVPAVLRLEEDSSSTGGTTDVFRARARFTCNGDTCHGDTCNGDTCNGDMRNGDTCNGDMRNGDTCNGDTPNGDTCNGDTRNSDKRNGDICNGDTRNGDTCNGDTCNGDTCNRDTCDDDRDLLRLRPLQTEPSAERALFILTRELSDSPRYRPARHDVGLSAEF
jgi:hypothetical protein